MASNTFPFKICVNLYCHQQYHAWIINAHSPHGFVSSVFNLTCELLPKILFQNATHTQVLKFLNQCPYHLTYFNYFASIFEAASLRFLQMVHISLPRLPFNHFLYSELLLCQHFSISFNFRSCFFYKTVNTEPPVVMLSLLLNVLNSWRVASMYLSHKGKVEGCLELVFCLLFCLKEGVGFIRALDSLD